MMIDSSTIARKNVTVVKVRYLKTYTDENGSKRTRIENRTVDVKYLKTTSSAETMLQIIKQKLFNLEKR